MYRVQNEEVLRRAGIEWELASTADQRVLRWFGACGKNERLPYGQKGVDGRSQWGTGARETEVRLDGWCKVGLWQQRSDCGGCATIRERKERVGSHCA